MSFFNKSKENEDGSIHETTCYPGDKKGDKGCRISSDNYGAYQKNTHFTDQNTKEHITLADPLPGCLIQDNSGD